MIDSEEMSELIRLKKCSGCGKLLEWGVYDEVTHDGVADVRILGHCPSWPDCKKPDDMVEFMATEWISREEYDNG